MVWDCFVESACFTFCLTLNSHLVPSNMFTDWILWLTNGLFYLTLILALALCSDYPSEFSIFFPASFTLSSTSTPVLPLSSPYREERGESCPSHHRNAILFCFVIFPWWFLKVTLGRNWNLHWSTPFKLFATACRLRVLEFSVQSRPIPGKSRNSQVV